MSFVLALNRQDLGPARAAHRAGCGYDQSTPDLLRLVSRRLWNWSVGPGEVCPESAHRSVERRRPSSSNGCCASDIPLELGVALTNAPDLPVLSRARAAAGTGSLECGSPPEGMREEVRTSTVAWLDTSADEQRRVRDLIALFEETESRDELGIDQIRDVLSDVLFPGTSVLQTRARYFLLVP